MWGRRVDDNERAANQRLLGGRSGVVRGGVGGGGGGSSAAMTYPSAGRRRSGLASGDPPGLAARLAFPLVAGSLRPLTRLPPPPPSTVASVPWCETAAGGRPTRSTSKDNCNARLGWKVVGITSSSGQQQPKGKDAPVCSQRPAPPASKSECARPRAFPPLRRQDPHDPKLERALQNQRGWTDVLGDRQHRAGGGHA